MLVPDSTDYYADGMVWTANTIDVTENYAAWHMPTNTLTSTFAITYEVFVFMPRVNANTRSAHYQIVHGGITDTFTVDQSLYFAEWISVGKYLFASSETTDTFPAQNLVRLSDATGEAYGTHRVGFDAVAFVPESAPPITDTAGLTQTTYLPLLSNGQATLNRSLSRYVSVLNPQRHYNMGCASGQNNERGNIILAFGQPSQVGFGFGTFIYDYLSLASTQQIAEAVKGFVRGYALCSPSEARMNIIVGTSNYKGETNANHGQAWAGMINDLHNWLTTANEAKTWAARISISGGNDIEPSWNTTANTRAWVDGYATTAIRPIYNFGSCDGCPTVGNPSAQPNNGWQLEDIWYVSYGARIAQVFPEIYARNGVNARQWQFVSLYAAIKHGVRIQFGGLLTQYQACQDRDSVGCSANGLDNTPQQGWEQLQAALNADIRTKYDLPGPSDISWQSQ